MNSTIVFIESNTSGTGELFLRRAHDLGTSAILVARDPTRYPFAGPLAEIITADTANDAALELALSHLDRDYCVAAVFSSSEYYIAAASRLAAARGLPGPDPAAVALCRNKSSQRQRLAQHAVSSPQWRTVSTAAEAQEFTCTLGTPVVVKPLTGSGSVGVRLAMSPAEAAAATVVLLDQGANERGLAQEGSVLVEEYVDGLEFSVEVFDGQVVGITQKLLGAPPAFVEIGHAYPANIPAPLAASIGRVAIEATQALGLHYGALHIEVRSGPSGPVIIEVNPRLAGGMIPALVHHACGVDLVDAALRRALGQAVHIDSRPTHRSAIRFVVPEHEGTIIGFSGLDAARNTAGIVEVTTRPQVPMAYRTHGDFRDRVGHIIASVPVPGEPLAVATRALAMVQPIYALSTASTETPHV